MPSAVDEARWATLRKIMNPDVEVDPLSEDIALLRQAEEEEERRQEEERALWLSRMKKSDLSAIVEEEDESIKEPVGRKNSIGGESSGEDDFDMENEIRLMRLAEEEEVS